MRQIWIETFGAPDALALKEAPDPWITESEFGCVAMLTGVTEFTVSVAAELVSVDPFEVIVTV